jgi:hypothetical protein
MPAYWRSIQTAASQIPSLPIDRQAWVRGSRLYALRQEGTRSDAYGYESLLS